MDRSCCICGKVIRENEPCYFGVGDTYVCSTCSYRKFIYNESKELQGKIDAFYKNRLEKGITENTDDKDHLLSNLLDVMDKMTAKDAEAINYIIQNIEERY